MASTTQILPNIKDLFTRISQGDEAAFTEVFYHYTQRIYHYILGRTKSQLIAEEIVQEVFIKIWTNREKLTEVINPESYIFSMAANKLFDWYRKMSYDQKIKDHIWQTIGDASNITFETLDLHNSQELVNKAIEKLSPQQKKIYLLSRQQGLSHSEIARELDLSEKTVNNHLSEALRLIREYIQKTPGATMASLIVILGLYH
jgi:RNA polymerase sigma-70 factor (ECF subfamily)